MRVIVKFRCYEETEGTEICTKPWKEIMSNVKCKVEEPLQKGLRTLGLSMIGTQGFHQVCTGFMT